MQREWARDKRQAEAIHNKKYYKPHYGPEETQEVVQNMRDANESKIKWQNNALVTQLDDQHTDSEIRRLQDELADRQRLQAALELQAIEDRKQKEKNANSKENNRRAWLEQMAYKDAFKETDEFFK